MSRRHNHTALAFIVLSAAACSDDSNSCDTSAQSSDSDANVSADSSDKKSEAGRGGGEDRAVADRGGRGAAPAGGAGGAGEARDSDAPKDGDDKKADRGEDKDKDEDTQGGKGGSSSEAAGGTGGAGGAPGSAMGGAGGTGAASSDDDAGTPDQQGPHLKTATLQGHLWLAQSGAGTTLTATGFDTPMVSGPVCIMGSVAATPDYNSNAALGLNLNQPQNGAPMPFTPTLAGLQVDVTNRAGSPLRFLINAQDGSGLWCANVNGSGGFIPWTSFNTACWDNSGTAYANQPLSVASVQVPGGIDAAIPYDFCLNTLTETAAPAAPPPAPFRPGANQN